MDLDRLYMMFKEKLYTDLTLLLRDDINELAVDVHRTILLALSSSYFHTLLTGGFREKYKNKIMIEVSNVPEGSMI